MNENTNYTILAAVRNMLKDVDPSPFTRPALDRVHLRIEQFIEDLLLESIRSARRQQTDVVSPVHVDLATDVVFLRRKRKIYSFLGSLGGIAVGAALAMTVEFTSGQGSWSSNQAIAALVMATAGGIAMTIQLLRE